MRTPLRRPRLPRLPLFAVLAALLATTLPGVLGAEEAGEADPLVVHEWGTFTSVQGSDGLVLEGLQHEEEALPDFVYDRTEVRDCPLREKGWKGLEVPATHVTQKMETPVLYFHARSPRRVRVRVDFVKGLITQWYPVSDLLGPPEGACGSGPLDVRTVERSFLQWDVDLVPRAAAAPAEIPPVAADDPWAYAREVDAAWVRTLPRQGPARAGPVEAEHYLFYRGLGTFDLPFRVSIDDRGRVSFRNGSDRRVDQVVAVEVGEGGHVGRYDIRCYVGPGETAADLLEGREPGPWRDGSMRGLRTDVEKILRGQGMNADEARAMVRTWSRSWFEAEGLRVFYTVPRPLVDAMLPLHVDPAPAEIHRALVGRIECIDPRTQREVEQAVRDIAEAAASATADPARVGAAKRRLERLGRFLEPHLRRVAATTADPRVRAMAEDLIPHTAGAGR